MIAAASQDIAARAMKIYDSRLRERLERASPDKFVAIEPDSGDFFLGETMSAALAAARQVHRDRLPLVLRVGHQATVHVGGMIP